MLLDNLLQQKADVEGLLPKVDVDIIRINAAALKKSLTPWPTSRLAELHKMLPVLAAGMWGPRWATYPPHPLAADVLHCQQPWLQAT